LVSNSFTSFDRLPFGRLHYLADEKPDHCLFAGAVLFELPGIRGDDFVDDLFQRRGVGGLLRRPSSS